MIVMVTFELYSKNKTELIYWYYPEGNKENKHGVIVVDLAEESIEVTELAEKDLVRIILPDEMNKLVDAINQMMRKRGETDLVKYTTQPIRRMFYGSHALSEIAKKIDNGTIPQKGTVAWY